MDDALLEQYCTEFASRRPVLDRLTEQITDLLRTLITNQDLAIHLIEGRCKGVPEYRDKIKRKGYTDPHDQMMDVVGVRAVMFFDADVDLVADLIRQEFVVDEKHSEDKRSPANELYFGYRSNHLVATLNEVRGSSSEYYQHKDQRIEFQVRSMLAHTWEAIDRQLDFKKDPGLSREGKRLMGRVSAMLETADQLFNEIRASEIDFRASIETRETEQHDTPLTLRWD